MLCEKTDNEASGSTEARAVTLIKYNFKKDKNNGKYSNTKNRVKKTQSHIHKPSQTLSREARPKTRNRLGLNNIRRKRIPNWICAKPSSDYVWNASTCYSSKCMNRRLLSAYH